jgi:transposase
MAIGSDESIAAVARQLGMNEGTLTNWVNTYRKDHPQEDAPLTVSERARLRELERENRELRMKSEFLAQAAAFFAREHQ